MTDLIDNKKSGTEPLSFSDAFVAVQDEIREKLVSSPPVIRAFTKHLAKTRGKYIRAYSLLTCAQNRDGAIHPDAVKISVALELLHLATLVHDDVIDDAKTRRGAETIQIKFGKRPAVICGDYLFCLALQSASGVSARDEADLRALLPDYMSRICLGELKQNMNNRNLDLTPAQYYQIISGKTAALFEASFFGGFVLSGEDRERGELYKQLGHHIGMIFQLTDDCADYELNYEQTKKPVKSDFEQGVITLPLIYTLDVKKELREKAQGGMSASDIVEAVRDAGGLIYTRTVVKKHYKKAMRIIELLDVSEEKQTRVTEILQKSTNGIIVGSGKDQR